MDYIIVIELTLNFNPSIFYFVLFIYLFYLVFLLLFLFLVCLVIGLHVPSFLINTGL